MTRNKRIPYRLSLMLAAMLSLICMMPLSCSKENNEPERNGNTHRPGGTTPGNNGGTSGTDADPNDPLSGGELPGGSTSGGNGENGNGDSGSGDNGSGSNGGEGESSDIDPDLLPIIGCWIDEGVTTRILFESDNMYTSYKVNHQGEWIMTQHAHFDYSDLKRWLWINIETDEGVTQAGYRCVIDGNKMTLTTTGGKKTIYHK